MSYSPKQAEKLHDDSKKKLSKDIAICQKVVETLESPGWKDIIGPIIDRMIIDVVGGKIGDVWTGGKIDKARKDEKREYWIGYKAALIELHGRAYFHKLKLPLLQENLKGLDVSNKPAHPFSRSRYNTKDTELKE